MHYRSFPAVIALGALMTCAGSAAAGTELVGASAPACTADRPSGRPWQVNFAPGEARTALPEAAEPRVHGVNFSTAEAAGQDGQTRQRVKPFEYSDGYKTRAKIHRIASFATLPLFIAEYAVGQSLYNSPGGANDSKKGAHGVLAGTIAGLFGVNTVTGVWNMAEASNDPNHKKLRTIHGILMLVADAGFVATGALANGEGYERGQVQNSGNNSTHRAVAITSMGIATFSYLLMLFGGR